MAQTNPLPKASVVNSPPMHPQAAVGTDTATLYLDDAMLDDVLPVIRRRLSETRHVDLDPRVHWTAKVALIAFAIASTLLVVTQ